MDGEAAPVLPLQPKQIAPLPTAVVNRIAAGEIIQRPANALKELIENALDAGATSIRVTVKDGGTKLLQIQDNGSGIRKADLGILCERFTTSKIKAFEDLSALSSYGFRGEALASISHVAHLTVTTKTRDEKCAWKATYSDGVMVPPKPGAPAEPQPTAGNDGTLLVVEDLFFNTPTRLKSLKSSSDEYARVVAIVTQYSIHNAGVAMVCKRASTSTPDVNTSVSASVKDNIAANYGDSVGKELVHVECVDESLGLKVGGWCSSANYSAKKSTFLFFINHRLVESTPIRRALEAFYGALLAKGSHPFVYLSLEIDPAKVDVNMHPTKREVGFEDEEEVVEVICKALGAKLERDSGTRTFTVQTLLPGPNVAKESGSKSGASKHRSPPPAKTSTPTAARKPAPNKMVRTDQRTQTLDAMFHTTAAPDARPAKRLKSDHDPDFASRLAEQQAGRGRTKIAQSECALRSVRELRKEVVERNHGQLEEIIRNHIFVGVADTDGALSMLQYQTKLYLVHHGALGEELFYQLALRQFGRFIKINLNPAPPLRDLIRLAVYSEDDHEASKLSPEDIVSKIFDRLMESRAMLDEYFDFSIDEDGILQGLPMLLPGYTPDLNKLPLFLLRLGVQVNWTEEKPCFETFLQELAYFYAPSPATDPKQIQHAVFPAAKQYLLPPERMLKKDFVQVTRLESLYKVFERC